MTRSAHFTSPLMGVHPLSRLAAKLLATLSHKLAAGRLGRGYKSGARRETQL